jgi:hypothetical protein
MPRQIVPVSDVAAILLTQDEGDLRYLPLSYTPPVFDGYTKAQSDARYLPITYTPPVFDGYTKAQSDARYEPLDTMYTKAESDARFQPVGSYSLTTHTHDATYSSLTHTHDATYLKLSGGTLTGDLMAGSGKAVHFANPANTISAGWKYVDAQGLNYLVNGAGVGTYFSSNGSLLVSGTVDTRPGTESLAGTWFLDSAGARRAFVGTDGAAGNTWRVYTNIAPQGDKLTVNLSTGYVSIPGGLGVSGDLACSGTITGNGSVCNIIGTANIQLSPAGTYIHPSGNNTINLGHPGLNWAYVWTYNVNSPGGAQLGINGGFHLILSATNGGWIYHRSTGHTFFDGSAGAIVAPELDNKLICGGTGNRWQYVAAVAGGINTSHVSMKKNIAPLDPVACAEAVLETDWYSYEYLPPAPPEPEAGESVRSRLENLDVYTKQAEASRFARTQNGYVLGSPAHRVHTLFGLLDREHASPSADLGVLACALQDALKRIAQLEAAR